MPITPLDDGLSLDVIESAEGRRTGGLRNGMLEVLPSPEIVVYVDGKPYIQPDGEFKGFYVSETSYRNPTPMPTTDCTRYLDARHIQYIVLPGGLVPEAQLGDLAIVYDPVTKKHVDAIFGDVGPSSESGEAALATLQRLGMAVTDGKSSPGQTRDDLFFLVFPNTVSKLTAAEPWPHAQSTIDKLAEAELANWGGVAKIEQVLAVASQGGPILDSPATAWVYDALAAWRKQRPPGRYDFDLPARYGRGEPVRFPCAPELVVETRASVEFWERLIGNVELGRAPVATLSGMPDNLRAAARIYRTYPAETQDELESPLRELARIQAFQERVSKLIGRTNAKQM